MASKLPRTGAMANAAGIGGSLTTLAYWALTTYTTMPDLAVVAAVSLIGQVGGYFAGKLANEKKE